MSVVENANPTSGGRQTMIIAATVGATAILILVAVVVAIIIYRQRRYLKVLKSYLKKICKNFD